MNELSSLVSITLLLIIMLFVYEQHRIDRLRNDLFALRDCLFDEAISGEIDFDSPAYGATRKMINGMVRFAHRLNLIQFMVFKLLMPSRVEKYAAEKIDNAFQASSEADRVLTRKYIDRANLLVIRHLATSPFFLATVFLPIVLMILARTGLDTGRIALRRFRNQVGSLDAAAYAAGGRSSM